MAESLQCKMPMEVRGFSISPKGTKCNFVDVATKFPDVKVVRYV